MPSADRGMGTRVGSAPPERQRPAAPCLTASARPTKTRERFTLTTRQIHDRIIGHADLAAYAARRSCSPGPTPHSARPSSGITRPASLTQRLIPSAVLTAFPHTQLTGAGLLAPARETRPTPPLRGDQPALGSVYDLHPTLRTP